MAMAIPDKLMRFDVNPNCRIKMNEMRTLTGSGNVTIRMLRKWNRKMMCTRTTKKISSVSAVLSVSMVLSMSSLRS